MGDAMDIMRRHELYAQFLYPRFAVPLFFSCSACAPPPVYIKSFPISLCPVGKHKRPPLKQTKVMAFYLSSHFESSWPEAPV